MAHHKRKKTKRCVRCTLCTQWRWMGNSVERLSVQIRRQLQEPIRQPVDS